MAHESFEDTEIAQILNQHFVAAKVDKEERPAVDSICKAVCQAFTGSGASSIMARAMVTSCRCPAERLVCSLSTVS